MLKFKLTHRQLNSSIYKTSRAEEGSRGSWQRVARGWNYCKLKNWERASLKKWMYNWWLHSTPSIHLCVLIVMFCFLYVPISHTDPLQLRWLQAIKRFSVHVIRDFFISLRLQIFMFCLSHALDGSGCTSYSLWIKSNCIILEDHTYVQLIWHKNKEL